LVNSSSSDSAHTAEAENRSASAYGMARKSGFSIRETLERLLVEEGLGLVSQAHGALGTSSDYRESMGIPLQSILPLF
jgi:hypothetical protein